MHFRTIVIGRGLIGTATAKYLSLDHPTALIGPTEPTDLQSASVFASHYDEARVQRLVGKDDVWTQLNVDAAARYPEIERQSGIQFHTPVGCLYVNPYGEDDYLEQAPSASARMNLYTQPLPKVEALEQRFPFFHFPSASVGVWEADPAGYINPRRLIEAQVALFQKNGGVAIEETVVHVESRTAQFHLTTAEGNSYSADQVVVAAGSFINHHQLLPQKLQLVTKSEVVLLVEVASEEVQQWRALPSLLYEINTPKIEGIYLLPPVRYPDGKYYLKIGANVPEDIYFERLEDIQQWFRETDSTPFASRLIEALQALMPHLPIRQYTTKKCIISRTPHGRPYIGETGIRGWFVAGGCNGYSAMCSDTIGSVTAHVVLNGSLPPGYANDAFELRFQNT